MTKAEMIERFGIEYYEEFKLKTNARGKERNKNNPKCRKRHNSMSVKCTMQRYNNDPDYKKDVMNKHKEYMKDYNNDETNYIRHRARTTSRYILFKQRKHTNIKGYEIHHAFGYEDPFKFIYIPRSLHKAIHSFLRENNINADTDHYKYISTMINECTEYTYISA